MMFFNHRKPRGFHHTFIYLDRRKEFLSDLERHTMDGQVHDSHHHDSPTTPTVSFSEMSGRRRGGFVMFAGVSTVMSMLFLLALAVAVFLML